MNTVNSIVNNGLIATRNEFFTLNNTQDFDQFCAIVRKDFEECQDLDLLKKFAVIMDQKHDIVDVEDKMCELMGEDEYFDFIEGE
ncbi:MAG: hypothetical protein ABNH21_06655 [Glaciecola sp.]|jgi:hypothetical protein